MAIRIGEQIVSGELNNTKRNCVFGWLDFGGEQGIHIEVAGNLEGDLAGRRFEFETRQLETRQPPAGDQAGAAAKVAGLETLQIGVVGTIRYHTVRAPDGPLDQLLLTHSPDRIPLVEKPCLYLEWFGQNGRVVAEIVNPLLTLHPVEEGPQELTPDPLPDAEGATGPGIVGYRQNEFGEFEELTFSESDDEEEDDPYKLFPRDLEADLAAASDDATEFDDREFAENPGAQPTPRSWDEVIPGIDPETKRMYEQWDEVFDGKKDEPLTTLFDPPFALKPPEMISDQEEAEASLKVLLARLALHSVAIDICPHFTPLRTYHWLLNHILPEADVHPRLGPTGIVQHYSTWESCPQCEADADLEYERSKNKPDE